MRTTETFLPPGECTGHTGHAKGEVPRKSLFRVIISKHLWRIVITVRNYCRGEIVFENLTSSVIGMSF